MRYTHEKTHTEESREKRRQKMKAHWQDTERRKKMTSIDRSKQFKDLWADPAYRKKQENNKARKEKAKKRWADPEFRKKQCAAIKAGKARRAAEDAKKRQENRNLEKENQDLKNLVSALESRLAELDA